MKWFDVGQIHGANTELWCSLWLRTPQLQVAGRMRDHTMRNRTICMPCSHTPPWAAGYHQKNLLKQQVLLIWSSFLNSPLALCSAAIRKQEHPTVLLLRSFPTLNHLKSGPIYGCADLFNCFISLIQFSFLYTENDKPVSSTQAAFKNKTLQTRAVMWCL